MRVLIADGMAEPAVAMFREAGYNVDLRTGVAADELLNLMPEVDAICIRSATQVTADVIQAGSRLKVIGRAGVGLDNVDRTAAAQAGVKVFNTPTATADSVAELTLGLMFSVARFIAEADATLKEGRWEKKRMIGSELGGKSLGLIGTGPIGQGVARRAQALGMTVRATKRDLQTVPDALKQLNVPVVPLAELLETSDFVSVHLPLNDGSRRLIDAAAIAKMKDGAYLINCSRGGVVCEEAVADAIRSGKLAGAGVDVYAEEPVKSNPFDGLARVVQTPHLGASTGEGQVRASTQLAEQVIRELG